MIHLISLLKTIKSSKFGSILIILFAITAYSCAPDNGSQNTDNTSNILDNVDSQTPKITALLPKDQTTEIDSTTNIRVFFSEAIQPTSLSVTDNSTCEGTIQLTKDNFKSCEEINWELSTDGKELVIRPTSDYEFLTTYSIWLSQSITDLSGNSLESTYLSSFQTEHSPGLGDTISSRLQKNLSDSGLLSENQTLLITSSGASALENEYLQYSEDPSNLILKPSYKRSQMV